ncbi:MAG: S8 family serine peptidase [Gammaproteobacteria bacterium]
MNPTQIVMAASQRHLSSIFAGPEQKSSTGAIITPVAWLHENLLGNDEQVLTFLFSYREAKSGKQRKLATVSVPRDSKGNFTSNGWGDVESISGKVDREVVTLTDAIISNGKGSDDNLSNIQLKLLKSPAKGPTAGRWPLIKILPLSITQPQYEDFWTVELRVKEVLGIPQVELVYYGPNGTYTAEPINIMPDGSFSGTTRKGETGVRFAGVFFTFNDATGTQAANYPILVQRAWLGNNTKPMSEAVGTRPILWISESMKRKSGVEIGRANFSTAAEAKAALAKLFSSGKVLAADSDDYSTRGVTNPPNDTYFNPAPNPGQYPYPVYSANLCCTGGIFPPPLLANDAWGVANATGQGVSLGVLDSGVVANHPDLHGRILGGHNALHWPWWSDWLRLMIPANWRTTTTDLYGHGTGVIGVATAVRNNNEGIAGVAQPSIRPVRVLDNHNAATDTSVAEGLQWLLDNNYGDIINMSFVSQSNADTHGGNWDPVIAELLRRATESGRVVVGGSGNIPTPVVLPPSSMPDVIAVGASDPNHQPTDYTAFGKNLDLLAPGGDNQDINDYLTVPWRAGHNCVDLPFDNDGDYCRKFGTSFAAPFVSGVVSMILTTHPNLQRSDVNCVGNEKVCVAQIRALVQRTGHATPTPDWDDSTQVEAIYDVNAYQAVIAALPQPLPPASNLQIANCLAGGCINPGIQLQWNAAVAPHGFNLLGYLIFRNGRPIFQNLPDPNPLIVNNPPFNDTTLPATIANVPQNGIYNYTVVALYQDTANQIYEQAISSNAIRKTCTAAGCN